MTNAREIVIRAAFVSDELTRAASAMILAEYGGYFRADGFGGYTFADGRTIEESAIAWHIATAKTDYEILEFIIQFARQYCRAGAQESVYFLDSDGIAYLAEADGHIIVLSSESAVASATSAPMFPPGVLSGSLAD